MNRVVSLTILVIFFCFFRSEAALDTYTNNTTVQMGAQPPISATNILNNGVFYANGVGDDYYFYDVLNYTNRNFMSSDYGFVFDHTPSGSGPIRMANYFVNSSLVTETNGKIFGAVEVIVSATNIINKGIIEAGINKVVLNGQNIDLSRGTLRLSAATNTASTQTSDRYWGTLTNAFVNITVTSNIVSRVQASSFVDQYSNGTIASNRLVSIGVTNPASYVYINPADPENIFKTFVFVRNTDTNVAVDVRFQSPIGFSFATPLVQWSNVVMSPTGIGKSTNLLYLEDTLGSEPSVQQFPNNYPFNYFLFSGDPGFSSLSRSNAAYSNAIFKQGFSDSESTAYGVQRTPLDLPANLSVGASLANQPGRIEVRGNDLTMNNTRIQAVNYLVLQATNNFRGSSNAFVTVPYSDISLATTNGLLNLTNLLSSYLGQMVGAIDMWSGRWTNVESGGVTNYYHVLVVNGQLNPKFPSKINNLSLNATNIFISDVLNVQSNFNMTAERLTLTTNTAVAGARGELNVESSTISFVNGLPNLQYLTNYGRISSFGDITLGNPLQLQSFINRGEFEGEGASVYATTFENSGSIVARNAALYLQSTYAGMTNSLISALSGDIFLKNSDLVVSGCALRSLRKLSLDVSNSFTDAGVAGYWKCGDGFDFATHPLIGDLFATTITNIAFDNAQTISSSMIADRGASPSSFTNSATIGRLVLDGGLNSQFVFTGDSTSNALYIDYLELTNNATNVGALFIDSNIRLYVAASSPLAPDKLAQMYPQLVWASEYKGANSTTNITLRNGQTITVNSSIPGSTTLDSDGDGVPNSIDPYPFDGLQVTGSTNVALQTVTISWFADSALWQYNIEYSTDLTHWFSLTSVTSGPVAGQPMTYQESLSVGVDRFYRVRTLSH